MSIKTGLRAEIAPMLGLALPLVLAEIGWMAMGVVDTMFVGRVSEQAIGAVSLGTVTFYFIAIFASGLLLGLDTLVAQAHGGGDHDDVRHSLINGVWLAVFLIPLVMFAVWAVSPLLGLLGTDPEVLRLTRPYLKALNWSAPPLLLYFGMRRYLQSINIVRPVMVTLLLANVVNVVCNWLFVFGNLGFPKMGVEGSGWATCVSRAFMAIALAVIIRVHDPLIARLSWKPEMGRIRDLLRLGFPAAMQIGIEWGVFTTATLLIARLSAPELAGHQITLTTVSMTYMMPLGFSSAAAVRVGQAIGRGDREGMARAGWIALGSGGAMMSVAAVCLLVFPHWIARLFTPDVEVIAASMALLRVAAFFQLFDGLQVVATGALRGAGDTRTPMLCHFTGYWLIGLPLGSFLCFHYGMGAKGLWTGLCVGLILIGVVLVEMWRRKVSAP